jgi:hypothetical protein
MKRRGVVDSSCIHACGFLNGPKRTTNTRSCAVLDGWCDRAPKNTVVLSTGTETDPDILGTDTLTLSLAGLRNSERSFRISLLVGDIKNKKKIWASALRMKFFRGAENENFILYTVLYV